MRRTGCLLALVRPPRVLYIHECIYCISRVSIKKTMRIPLAYALCLNMLAAWAQEMGRAVVWNNCGYEVYVWNVPAADGGYYGETCTLPPQERYIHAYTVLTNGNGWSIKLGKTSASLYDRDVLQLEYTIHDSGDLWYDLSEIDGKPFGNEWYLSADYCLPRQVAYQYPEDNAAMQSCPRQATVTLTLCPFDGAYS